jgi:O-antigen/teichoic acid export membrane protein
VANAGLWLAAGRIAGRVLDLASLFVLARVLAPADFGLVAKAMVVVVLVEALTDAPLIQPLLRADRVTDSLLHAGFTLGLCRAAVILSFIAVSTPALASLYSDTRLTTVLLVLAVGPASRGLLSPRMSELVREHRLRPEALMTVSSKLAALLAVLLVTAFDGGYWAIVAGSVAGHVFVLMGSYVVAPYRPRVSLESWSEFSDVVGWNSLAQAVAALNFQVDRLVLARLADAKSFGAYSVSSDLSGVPFQSLVYPLYPTFTSLFARGRTSDQLDRYWTHVLNGLLAVAGSILVALAFLAEPLVIVLLGHQWVEFANVFAILALVGLPNVIGHAVGPLAIACYRTRSLAGRAAVELLVKLPLTLVGYWWLDLAGAALARGIAGASALVFSLGLARELTGLPIRTQLFSIWRTTLALLAFAAIGWGSTELAQPYVDDASLVHLLGAAVAAVLAASCGQVVVMMAAWRAAGRPSGIEDRLVSYGATVWSNVRSFARNRAGW